MKKLFFYLLPLLFIYFLIINWPDKYVHLVVCDVGQGDAILITKGFFQLLIDTGPDEKVLNCLQEEMPFWDKKIDVLVLTHYDNDHIGGFSALSQTYHLPLIFTSLTEQKNTAVFLELKEILEDLIVSGSKVKEPFLGQQISYYDSSLDEAAGFFSNYIGTNKKKTPPSILTFSFLTPYQLASNEIKELSLVGAFLDEKPETELSDINPLELMLKENDNDGSIALLFQYGQLKTLLLGDLEISRQADMLTHRLITGVDILKVAHHGAKGANDPSVLDFIVPETALVSCGKNNSFGHPHEEVISHLESLKSRVWRTDLSGKIEILLEEDRYALRP